MPKSRAEQMFCRVINFLYDCGKQTNPPYRRDTPNTARINLSSFLLWAIWIFTPNHKSLLPQLLHMSSKYFRRTNTIFSVCSFHVIKQQVTKYHSLMVVESRLGLFIICIFLDSQYLFFQFAKLVNISLPV